MIFIRIPINKTVNGETEKYEIITSLSNVSLNYQKERDEYAALVVNNDEDGDIIRVTLDKKTYNNILTEMRASNHKDVIMDDLIKERDKIMSEPADSNMDGIEI